MRGWMVLGAVFVGGLTAWADITVIYRKSDNLVVGYVFPPMSVQTELRNTVQSELGGTVSDYGTVSVPDAVFKANRDKDVHVTAQGTVTFDPGQQQDNQAKRQSAIAKLKGLGLTSQEVNALFGGSN